MPWQTLACVSSRFQLELLKVCMWTKLNLLHTPCDYRERTLIRECSSTLYVGFAHVVPPTSTKFKPLLLPTQAGMLYTNTHKHRTLYFKSTVTFIGPGKR